MNKRKLLQKLITSPNNIRFGEFRTLVEAFGFTLIRVSGSHHIFECPRIPELINIQNVRGQAKPYQIRQFLNLIERHDLSLGDDA